MKQSIIYMAAFFITFSTLFISCDNDKKDKDYEKVLKERDIDHGKYLVTSVAGCLDCHSTRQFEYFSGPVKPGTEGMGGQLFNHENIGMPGNVYSRNITSDTATGIGNWTDDEIYKTITTGINKNGDTLFPLMPYHNLNQVAKKDLLDIIAYIRTLPPISNKVAPRQLMIPISMVYAPPKNKNQDSIVVPDMTDKVKYGAYLVNMVDCYACHTPMNEKGEYTAAFSGGMQFKADKFTVFSANITPDSATGIGSWNETKFLNKFASYRDLSNIMLDPGKKNSYMPWSVFATMNDVDLSAIYAYLRSLPPINHKVDKYPPDVK